MKKAILGIDLQYDFCNPKGALHVKGAERDVERLYRLISANKNSINAIILSMDSHQPVHIAHQVYWKDEKGNHPNVFDSITIKDAESRRWIPQFNASLALDYLTKLEAVGEVCTIWPPHCIIGTKGWSLDAKVFAAIEDWTISTGIQYTLVNKGMYQATEHYSIFKAAVEYSDVESTLFNTELVDQLSTFDQILIVGEAADFCVANSLKDLLANTPSIASKIYMLTDCMSYIVEKNEKSKAIFEQAKQMGVTFCKSTDI